MTTAKSNNTPTHFLSIKKIVEGDSSKKIKSAYLFARLIHKNRKRFSGDPFVSHVVETADIILQWFKQNKLRPNIEVLICAALLHDSIEYEKIKLTTIENKFGHEVRKLVEGVSDLRSNGSENVEKENLRIIAKSGYLDPRVFIIKLADRLHNMRTHHFLPRVKQIPKAEETMNVYVKLAESMGMWEVKKELEDICFYYLYPDIYKKTKSTLKLDKRLKKSFDEKIVKDLRAIYKNSDLVANIKPHINGLWTIYQKHESSAVLGTESTSGFLNINDIKSFSIITHNENIISLYILLGLLHSSKFQKYIDIKQINDYIAKPQPNKFSAIQTTLNLPEGKVEILFTTKLKEEFNNHGIVALLKNNIKKLSDYKRNIVFDEEKTAWFLPLNATYYDFIYQIGVGPQASSVIVDGKKRRLSEKVENGVIVKVNLFLNKKRIVNKEVLDYCLPQTRVLVEKQIYLSEREKRIRIGQKIIESVLKPRGLLNISDVAIARTVLINNLLVKDTYDLYYRIASGNIHTQKVAEVLDKYKISKKNLGFSTLRISGKNKPGILSDVIAKIKKLGGNIFNIASSKPLANATDKYSIRILFKGLSKVTQKELKKHLSNDKRINKFELV